MWFRNSARSLILHGSIKTTLPRAKKLRPVVEKLVSTARKGDLVARRRLLAKIPDKEVVRKLIDEIAPRYKKRPGGYLRIIKLGPRKSDGAEMARLEWVKDTEGRRTLRRKAQKEKGGKNAN